MWPRLVLAVFILAANAAIAREGLPPVSSQRHVLPLSAVNQVVLLPTDPQKELAADQARRGGPLRYAVAQQVQVTPATHGTWESVPEGRIWRLRVLSAGATDLNFGFTTFWLPEGATLHLSSEDENYTQGPYTARDNKEHMQFWSPVLPGRAAVIELFVPAAAVQEPQIILVQVGTGYRDLFRRKFDAAIAKAGACEIDVVCPEGLPWTNEIRSVARISINGNAFCTGTLMANTASNFRNFFLTANHCAITSANAATVVAYWNYQAQSCGARSGGSLAQNQSGAIFRASKYDVDFCLIELDDVPDPTFRVYYSGWDRSGVAAAGAVGIHHPQGDEKSISFSSNPLTTVNSCIQTGGSSTHWQVIWSSGVTEPGSSGSGIWDPASHKLLGTLSGGDSDCATPYLPDCYGKFSVAWASGGTSSSRLREWLDPLSSGVTSIPGADPAMRPILVASNSAVVWEGCAPTNGVADPGETVGVSFWLQNIGLLPTTNLIATLQPTGGVTFPNGPRSYGIIPPGSAAAQVFSFTASGSCGGTINCSLSLKDGTNYLGTLTFPMTLGRPDGFTENFDGVSSPALPSAWSSSPAGAWTTSTAQSDTPFNSAHAEDLPTIRDQWLTSPSISVPMSPPPLVFRHWYDFESSYDGGVLEISISGGAFQDILSAGGFFSIGGYNSTISTVYSNPLAGRPAWSGTSAGFVTASINLPAAAAGKKIQLRWRLGSDESTSAVGWFVDTIGLSAGFACCDGLPPVTVNAVLLDPTDRTLQLSVQGQAGSNYVLQSSSDLSTWVPVFTNASPFTFLHTNPPSPTFYRASFQQ